MEKTILTLIGFCAANLLGAQSVELCRSVVSTAGGTAIFATQTYEFTIGEPLIETFVNEDLTLTLTQGFNQPEICLTSDVQNVLAVHPLGLEVFPNPTADQLQVRFKTPIGKAFDLEIFNALGQRVFTSAQLDISITHQIDCRSFDTGTYFLFIRSDSHREWTQIPFLKIDP